MKVTKAKLNKIILEETINFLEEIFTGSEQADYSPATKGDISVLKNAIMDLIDDRDAFKKQLAILKKQVMDLSPEELELSPVLPSTSPDPWADTQIATQKAGEITKTIDSVRRVAEDLNEE